MTWLVVLMVVAVLTGVAVVARRRLDARHARELEARGSFRLSRRAADEDVTRFGEELTELHFDTLTDELDPAMRQDYQRALDAYEEAKSRLGAAEAGEDVTAVTHALDDGRFAMACVLARRDRAELPERRPPCFFNPAHGPARSDVPWAPPGGVEREVPVCFRCGERLAGDLEPDVRLVRYGHRYVPWFRAGPAYAAYVEGYYGRYARDGVFPDFIVPSILVGGATVAPATTDWSGWGTGTWGDEGPGGTPFDGGGHGFGPGDGGFGDFGGGDFGGGDFGGGGIN